jgi:hypothetical protein
MKIVVFQSYLKSNIFDALGSNLKSSMKINEQGKLITELETELIITTPLHKTCLLSALPLLNIIASQNGLNLYKEKDFERAYQLLKKATIEN